MREGGHEQKGQHGHRGHCEHRGHEKDHKRGIKDFSEQRFQSAQTFRRGRAIAFLDRLNVKRSTLMQQLNQPEYDSIKQVISGELKAVDAIIQEFIHTFELREIPFENDKKGDGDDATYDNN